MNKKIKKSLLSKISGQIIILARYYIWLCRRLARVFLLLSPPLTATSFYVRWMLLLLLSILMQLLAAVASLSFLPHIDSSKDYQEYIPCAWGPRRYRWWQESNGRVEIKARKDNHVTSLGICLPLPFSGEEKAKELSQIEMRMRKLGLFILEKELERFWEMFHLAVISDLAPIRLYSTSRSKYINIISFDSSVPQCGEMMKFHLLCWKSCCRHEHGS